jgi:hypothetical protein
MQKVPSEISKHLTSGANSMNDIIYYIIYKINNVVFYF